MRDVTKIAHGRKRKQMRKILEATQLALAVASTLGVVLAILLFAIVAPFIMFDDVTLVGVALTAGITGWVAFIIALAVTFCSTYFD